MRLDPDHVDRHSIHLELLDGGIHLVDRPGRSSILGRLVVVIVEDQQALWVSLPDSDKGQRNVARADLVIPEICPRREGAVGASLAMLHS